MELRHLNIFVAVADAGGFTAAAGQLGLTQPAVSATIRSLEDELGVELIVRLPRGGQLTGSGRALLPEARAALAAAAAARHAVAAIREGRRDRIAVGTILRTAEPLLGISPIAAAFKSVYPDVDLLVRQGGPSRALEQSVRDGTLDAAFVSLHPDDAVGLRLRPIGSDALQLIAPEGHPLSRRQRVEPLDLGNEVFIDLASGWGARAAADRLFRGLGLKRATCIEADDMGMLLDYVASGLGLAVVPRQMCQDVEGVVILPFAAPPEMVPLSLATASSRQIDPAVQRLMGEIKTVIVTS